MLEDLLLIHNVQNVTNFLFSIAHVVDSEVVSIINLVQISSYSQYCYRSRCANTEKPNKLEYATK